MAAFRCTARALSVVLLPVRSGCLARCSHGTSFKNFRQSVFTKPGQLRRVYGGLAVAGAIAGSIGHAAMQSSQDKTTKVEEVVKTEPKISPPKIPPSRVVTGPTTKTGLSFTLYQYQTCPFCCKVRAFLDYYGIPYNIVEVNPVLRQQIKFSQYKKVPILLTEQGNSCWQLNDSSVIISLLGSFLVDVKQGIEPLLDLYKPTVVKDASGKEVSEIFNKYSLMYGSNHLQGKSYEDIKQEREWRMWADQVLVHALSPNVYRSPKEALQAFNYFSEVGEWEKNFPSWERTLVIYVGAAAMFLVGKRLKKKYKLKEDVRESLYDLCNEWTNAVGPSQQFHGGNKPNLADLAVYGVLSSIEGCETFGDLLRHTKIGPWYSKMKDATSSHQGSETLPSAVRASKRDSMMKENRA